MCLPSRWGTLARLNGKTGLSLVGGSLHFYSYHQKPNQTNQTKQTSTQRHGAVWGSFCDFYFHANPESYTGGFFTHTQKKIFQYWICTTLLTQTNIMMESTKSPSHICKALATWDWIYLWGLVIPLSNILFYLLQGHCEHLVKSWIR